MGGMSPDEFFWVFVEGNYHDFLADEASKGAASMQLFQPFIWLTIILIIASDTPLLIEF